MKTILLIRHAKSSWENFTVADEDRPLNERGKRNAHEMAKRLLKRDIRIDAFLSSPAKRAKTTAQLFAKEYGIDHKHIILIPELYMANRDAFLMSITNAPQKANSIAIFSHNNGITQFANEISEARIDNMPTCAVFAVRSVIDDWSAFQIGDNQFYFFDYPKKN